MLFAAESEQTDLCRVNALSNTSYSYPNGDVHIHEKLGYIYLRLLLCATCLAPNLNARNPEVGKKQKLAMLA